MQTYDIPRAVPRNRKEAVIFDSRSKKEEKTHLLSNGKDLGTDTTPLGISSLASQLSYCLSLLLIVLPLFFLL